MTTYLKTQDPFDKGRKVKALRPTIRMGGTTSHNGKQDTPEMIKKKLNPHNKWGGDWQHLVDSNHFEMEKI